MGKAVERLDRVENPAFAVVLQRLDLAAPSLDFQFVEEVMEIEGVFQCDGNQRLLDDVAKQLDVPEVCPLGVLALLQADPKFDEFLFGCPLGYDSEFTSHPSTPS